jgi:hypothetical protein
MLVMGSTVNATYKVTPCETDEKAVVYYKFVGTGARFRISTCTDATNFDSALALFDNAACETCPHLTNDYDLECDEEGMASTIELLSEPDVVYTIAVRGVNKEDMGEFGLIVQEFVRPSNDVCSKAIPIVPGAQPSAMVLDGSGNVAPLIICCSKQQQPGSSSNSVSSINTTTVAYGSISNATASSLLCLSGYFPTAFYTVVGTGQRMRVSTCTREVALNFKSVIHVDTGVCDSLACSSWMNDPDAQVACENSPTGFASTVKWETEPDTLYTISVRGLTEDQRGDFGLSLQSFGNVTKEGDDCQVCDVDPSPGHNTSLGVISHPNPVIFSTITLAVAVVAKAHY